MIELLPHSHFVTHFTAGVSLVYEILPSLTAINILKVPTAEVGMCEAKHAKVINTQPMEQLLLR